MATVGTPETYVQSSGMAAISTLQTLRVNNQIFSTCQTLLVRLVKLAVVPDHNFQSPLCARSGNKKATSIEMALALMYVLAVCY